jgi:hypothetical protein
MVLLVGRWLMIPRRKSQSLNVVVQPDTRFSVIDGRQGLSGAVMIWIFVAMATNKQHDSSNILMHKAIKQPGESILSSFQISRG